MKILSGGEFKASLPNLDFLDTKAEANLQRLVRTYNSSGNPGKFAVIREGARRIYVVGHSAGSGTPVLDNIVEIQASPVTLLEALTNIVAQLSSSVGRPVQIGTNPTNLLRQVRYVPPTGKQSARQELAALLDAAPVPLIWIFMYDANDDFYALNVAGEGSQVTDGKGRLLSVPGRRVTQPSKD